MESLPVITRAYECYKDIVVLDSRLDKRWRYTLGASIENSLLKLLEELVMAKSAPKPLKASYLLQATSQLEVATLKLRLLLELKLSNETTVFQLQAKLQEIGRMLGGWLKSVY